MKKVILFATVSIFAVSTMLAQQTTGAAPAKKEEKPKTEAAPAKMDEKKDEKKGEKKSKTSVKKVPAKKAEGETK